MTGFTIAHFTDAHLPLHGRFRAAELCGKRTLSALNWARKRRQLHRREVADALRADILACRPGHVVMTGDVVNFGLEREFTAAAAWLGGCGPDGEVSFVPGNHEALTRGAEAAGAAAFRAFTSSDDDVDDPEAWPWMRVRGPVALIGVSTAIPTPPLFAQGEAGPAQVAALRRRLRAARERGLCRIVLIHHPPTEMSRPRKALRDRKAVAAVIAEEGAELILHGHNHRNQLSWIEGAAARIPVLGAPSASGPAGRGAEPAEWRLLNVASEGDGYRIGVLRRTLTAAGEFEIRGRFSLPPLAEPAPTAA